MHAETNSIFVKVKLYLKTQHTNIIYMLKCY